MRTVAILFISGIILFSGSLYIMSLNEYLDMPGLKALGALTPIGGLLFIIAWLMSAYEIIKTPTKNMSRRKHIDAINT